MSSVPEIKRRVKSKQIQWRQKKSGKCVQRGRVLKGQNMERWGQRGTEICGFVGSAWHSLPLLKPCDQLASLVSILRTGEIDTALWMNSLSGHLTSLARLWLFSVVVAHSPWNDQIFFPPAIPALPSLDLTIHLRRLKGISQWKWRVNSSKPMFHMPHNPTLRATLLFF